MDEKKNNNSNIKNLLANIKNKFIFKRIFAHLEKNNLLKIIQYNKKFQNKLNIELNNYKINFLKIEIEIIPKRKKFGEFINISKNNKSYYHIYFNDGKEEIKRNKIYKADKVTKIRIIIDYEVKTIESLFSGCHCVKKINFIKFNRKDFTNMNRLFSGCSSLEELNLSNFNTDNVKIMSFMFNKCSSLKELNLSKFNTKNVRDMSHMFHGCRSIKKLNISNFVTSNVTNMYAMFELCSSLKELNLSSFNTDRVKDMSYMFACCESLKKLNLSNFNNNNSPTIFEIFSDCPLKDLNCSNMLIINQYLVQINFNIYSVSK